MDEIVLIANVPGSAPADAHGARVIENPQPLGYAANLNRGIAETTGELVLVNNPDAVPEPGAVAALVAFTDAHPRCGVAGPQLLDPDGSWQPSRRRFPTVGGTIVRRTPLRRVCPPLEHQRAHYHLDERPTEPVEADWMLGGSLLLRRAMVEELGGFDEGFRMYGEEIDLCYRAAKAGWERWYVPAAVVRHRWDARERPAALVAADAVALALGSPLRPQAPGASARAAMNRHDSATNCHAHVTDKAPLARYRQQRGRSDDAPPNKGGGHGRRPKRP